MSEVENVDEIISLENLGFGNILRNAREKKGLSLADVGSELRLDQGVVYAIENQHMDKLPEPAYVCGYIRNYARLMELDVEHVVNSYKKDISLKSNLTSVNSISQALDKKQEKRTILFLFFLILLFAFAGFIGWQLWENKQGNIFLEGQFGSSQNAIISLNQEQQFTPVEIKNNTSITEVEASLPTVKIAEEQSQQQPATEPVIFKNENSVDQDTGENSLSVAEEQATQLDNETSPVQEIKNNEEITDKEKRIATSKKQLEFVFSKNSWISVKDGKNKSLIYDLIHKGEQLTLSGLSPVDIFLGDGTGVKLLVDGDPFDFTRFINKKNIAKFIVE